MACTSPGAKGACEVFPMSPNTCFLCLRSIQRSKEKYLARRGETRHATKAVAYLETKSVADETHRRTSPSRLGDNPPLN